MEILIWLQVCGAPDYTFLPSTVWNKYTYHFYLNIWLLFGVSLAAQKVKKLPAVQENGDQSLDWEDPLKKEIATHSSVLDWRIPWSEEPGGLQSMRSQRVRHNWAANTFTFTFNTVFIVQESLQNQQHMLKKESSVQNMLVWKEISEESNRELFELRQ